MSSAMKESIVDSIVPGAHVLKEYSLVPGLTLVSIPAGTSVPEAETLFGQSSNILYSERDYKIEIDAMPDDTLFPQLWGMHNIGQTGGTPDADIDAPEAWNYETGSSDVIVAVIDTGVDYDHEDLADNMWVNTGELNGSPGVDDDNNGFIDDIYGYDFANNDGDPMDDNSHGTHCSGTIGGVGNNGIGVAGVCWNVKIMALKFLSASGGGATMDAIGCVDYAVQMGATLTSNSWGGGGYSQALKDAIDASGRAGMLFVAAAGNSSANNDTLPHYPSSYDLENIIAVMSTDQDDAVSGFSCYGLMSVDLAAPGSSILSSVPGNSYDSKSGTSMSTPHVAGACALLKSASPSLGYIGIKDAIFQSVNVLPSLDGLCVTAGRLNVAEAVELVAVDVTPPSPDPMEWRTEPTAVGVKTICMEAVLALDSSGVEYYFECTSTDDPNVNVLPSDYDSVWQSSETYSRDDFVEGTTYTFRVMARDLSENLNETQWSPDVSATTASPTDDLPPFPSPAQWLVRPKAVHYDSKAATNRVSMRAREGFDESLPIQYKFDCVSVTDGAGISQPIDPVLSSAWQSFNVYTINFAWNASFNYAFTVTVRDSAVPSSNETAPSEVATFSVNATGTSVYTVPVPYRTIQSAINATQNNGDTVVVRPGTYSGSGNRDIDFNARTLFPVPQTAIDIIVRSIDPDNPAVVAATIIDCGGLRLVPMLPQDSHRGFIFRNGETSVSELAGFTITGGYICVDGAFPTVFGQAGNPGLPSRGGAISCTTASSPTISKCVITNCVAEGGYGSPGAPGAPQAGSTNGGNAGNGALGAGGAIYCDPTSRPAITDLTIDGCFAEGGYGWWGGRGADADPAGPTAAGVGGNGGNAGAAFGGAIFVDAGNPGVVITNTTIRNCGVVARNGGDGGDGGDDTVNAPPVPGTPGGAGSSSNAVGGGIACGANGTGANVTIINCTIDNNQATSGAAGTPGNTGLPTGPNPTGTTGNNSLGHGGGVWYDANCGAVTINGTDGQRTTISNNTSDHGGGGIRFNSSSANATSPTLTNCDITGNATLFADGGGIRYGTDGTMIIDNCLIDQNTAIGIPNRAGGGIYAGRLGGTPPTVTIRNGTVISGNTASAGGGVYASNTNLNILSSSEFLVNTADVGAGLWIGGSGSNLTITDSELTSNSASQAIYGQGGAMLLSGINGFTMNDSLITGNDSNGYGGGLYLEGFNATAFNITNSLFTENTALYEGGAISCNFGAWTQIYNCTIANNATEEDNIGIGGGIHCSENFAWVEVFDSIIWGNTASQGSQLAAGRYYGSLPGYEWADIDINSSDVQDGLSDVFQELPPEYPFGLSAVWFLGGGNIDADPEFLLGYFLSANDIQGIQSPCVDAGDINTTILINDPNYTTRTDFGVDTAPVDMGYHYDASEDLEQFTLTVEVVNAEGGSLDLDWPGGGVGSEPGGAGTYEINRGYTVNLHAVFADPNSPLYILGRWEGTNDDTIIDVDNFVTMISDRTVRLVYDVSANYAILRTSVNTNNGTIDPSREGVFIEYSPDYLIYERGTVVTLKAYPDNPVSRVRWRGTDYDYHTSNIATVTLDQSRDVDADFYQPNTLIVGPSGEGTHTSIQHAIEEADEDDIIQVLPGTYNIYESPQPDESHSRIFIDGKRLTLRGSPQDPSATVIQGGFLILNVGRDTVIEGFTISGQYGGATYVTPNTAGMDGWPGDPVSGGGMRLFEYAPYRVGNVFITTAHPHDDTTDNGSPTVKNCVFFNCSIRGDNGGHGATGTGDGTLAILGEPGHGGWAGWAHGGAVAIGSGADPIFVDCEFIDNIAIGGDGGNGGNAAPALGGHGGNWGDPLGDSLTFLTWEHGPFEEYWFYSGFGGAVYCGNNSKPEFIDCEFSGNVARGGSCGVSGNNVLWEDVQTFWPFEHYLIDRFGGAVYGARGSMPIFENCEFVGNQADTTGPESHRDGEPTVSDDVNISFGGAVAFEDGSVPEFTDCTFTNNEATLGGAAYTVLAGFNAISTVFENNTALNAGALAVIEGTASIEDSSFAENTATAPGARGGAIFSFDSTVEIFSSELENNTAEGSGGGVYASGNDVVTIKNSLLHDNNAGSDGGAIASELMAETHVSSSTVVGNIAGTTTQMIDENGEVVFVITGTGGGLSSGVNSNVIVTDSIFWDNEAANGPQLSVGLENSTLAVSYSDIEGEMQNVYINDPSSTLLWGLGNINVNPLFATGLFGDHYLSYVDDTPNLQSPCVDTGSDLASNLGYSNYTTSVDHIPDENDVDMGYHQKLSDNFYTLNIQTFAGNSGVLPVLNVTSGVFNEYMTVPLEVLNIDDMPPGYRVQWTGTNKDAEVGSTNTVTMLLYDMVVEVEFVVHIQNNLLVPAQYATVEEAITVANSGDKITLAKDLTHYVSNPDGIDLMGKALTITSDIDPENPNFDIIASTIIDCQGSRYYPGRAFRFHNGEGEDTVILGLTIVNGYTVGDLGIDGGIPGGPVDPGDDNSPVIAAAGTDAEGDGYGGAILCEGDLVGRPSSPTIKYCVFVNNNVTGGQGGDGINGFPIFDEDSDVDGEWGGAAGSGTGNGYGGAIALIDGSSPKIIGCMFTNNSARGGSAGNAGNGSINYGSGRESWGGDGGNSIGDGIGGAIYASSQSSPLIQDCVFEINFASEGNAGLAGVTGAGGDLDPRAQNGVNGTVITFGLVAGGAIYYDIATEVNLNVNINSSSFTGNSAYTTSVELVDVGLEVGATLATITNYTRGGAVYCAEGARGTIAGNGSDEYASEFISNLGGAVYLADYSLVDISDTLFKDNSDAEEGGAIYIGSGEQIDLVRCDFLSNSSIINGGAITLNRNAAITGCTFGGNDTVYNGGAIEAFNESIELSLDINACSFGGNTANFGGAIYIQRFDANFDQCYIIGNTAVDGGGAYFVTGSEDPNNNGVIFTNGIIGDNRATGKFGGAAFMNVSAIIENSIIENNITEASDGYGGGLNFSVGNFLVGHSLKNCLVTGNSSISRGGAIACSLGASPEIMNSTFRENEAMFGGALWCDYSSTPTIIDSIFENNRGHAIGEDIGDDSTNADISYSLFYNNPDGDHGLYDSAIGGNPATSTGKAALEALLTPEDTDIYDNDPNIYIYDDDPVFVDGPLGDSYLYQGRAVAVIVAIEITDTNDCECLAGEVDCYDIDDVDDCKMRVNDPNDVYDPYIYMHDTGVVNIVDQSPAIDTGSGLASGPNMAMDTFTTNPALPGSGIDPNDKGQVDIGYHYKNLEQGAENISAFKKVLTIEIVDSYGNVIDCDSGDCHGTYELSPEPDSSSGDDHTYYISTQVTVELIPATGYRVASWSGAIDDSSLEKNNFVIMDDD
ncbi:MAG: S8 family serine peptidase, partial [Planctomycetes bacterium]|nr:S8 family serine peptidase [Planctomycetota bacterium]